MESEIKAQLEKAGITATPVRLLIYREIIRMDSAFSLADLETELETVDKSTIFRSLNLFLEKGMLHEIDDGSGSRKYCRCTCAMDNAEAEGSSSHHQHDSHIHFSCPECHRTFCIKDIHIPHLPTPKGFEVHETSCVMKGLCPDCARKHRV